jgi:polar amino acid transport system substrate-binding protein
MARDNDLDRRSYLRAIGAGGLAAGLAGCIGLEDGGGDGGGDGGDGGDGGTDTPTEGDGGDDGTETEQTQTETETEAQQTIVAGTAPGFPPFEYKENGELVGFDVELTEEIVSRTDFEFGGWETFEFDSLIPALGNENIDLIAAAMTITDERDQQIDFSDPYYEANQAVLVRSEGDFSPSSREDLSGHVVGAQSGTTGEGEIDKMIEEGILSEGNKRTYDNYTLAVQDLENGNVDAIVVDVPVAENFAESRNVGVAFTIETGEQYGFGIREDDDSRQEAVNAGLQAVVDDGTFDDLISKYFE